jgi:C4-dicarboxylate transporter
MPINEEFKKVKKTGVELGGSVRERTVGYITGALGLVAGLAWNDAIKSLIDSFVSVGSGGIIAKFIYAVLVTVIIVVITSALIRNSSKN